MRLTLNNRNVAAAKRKICIVQKSGGRTQTFLDFMEGRACRDFEKIVKLDVQSNDPSHLSVIQDSNSLGRHFAVRPKGGMLSPFSLEINHFAGAPAPRINAGVDPNRGEVFISPENQTQGQSSTTVSISPFALEIPPFPSSCAMVFAPISQFTKPSQWEKFPGGNIADRFKFWFLKSAAGALPIRFYYGGEEPQIRWSLNWWRAKEISLVADHVGGNISSIYFSDLAALENPHLTLRVDAERKWFDFQFEHLGYKWAVHFSFKRLMSTTCDFQFENGDGILIGSQNGATLVLRKKDGTCLRLEFDREGANKRYLILHPDGKKIFGNQAIPWRDKAEFLPDLGQLKERLIAKKQMVILKSLFD